MKRHSSRHALGTQCGLAAFLLPLQRKIESSRAETRATPLPGLGRRIGEASE